LGLYGALEEPGSGFLERNGLDPDGELYLAIDSLGGADGVYETTTPEHDDPGSLLGFLRALQSWPISSFRKFVETELDADALIDYQVGQVLANNADHPHHHHFLYYDRTWPERWSLLPWDLTLTFGKRYVFSHSLDNPGLDPWFGTRFCSGAPRNELLDRFFGDTNGHYHHAYLVRLWTALEETYTVPVYDERLASLQELLEEEGDENGVRWGWDFRYYLSGILAHVASRGDSLRGYLRTRYPELRRGPDRLMITEILYDPFRDEELEYIELWNPTDVAIDVQGWSIECDGHEIFRFDWGRELVFSGEIVIVAASPSAFRERYGEVVRVFPLSGDLSDRGGELRVKDAGPGHPATVDLVRYESGGEWPAEAAGLGASIELTDVHAARDNDVGSHWRAAFGGTPGVISDFRRGPPSFRRGDANSNGVVEVSDAVFTLLDLFVGGSEPLCRKAEDSDDTGDVEITDALFLLEFLFRGGPSPPSPWGSCGVDPTADALECRRYPPCGWSSGG
jgi:hypothetical protein